jgi:hypothetical protein
LEKNRATNQRRITILSQNKIAGNHRISGNPTSHSNYSFRAMGGFSLFEMVLGIILTGIISGIVVVVINIGFRITERVQARKTVVLDGVTAINKFDRDIRYLSNDQALLLADIDQIQFQNTQGLTLDYFITGEGLYRRVVGFGDARLLAKNVDMNTSRFRYYDYNKSELTNLPLSATDRKKVWIIELLLDLTGGDQVVRYQADVFPENLKLVSEPGSTNGGLGGPPPPPGG